MPKEIEDKIIWLFILLPGFLSVSLIGQIVDLGRLTEFQVVFYSFVLTLVNLFIALPIWWWVSRRVFLQKYLRVPEHTPIKSLFYGIVVLVSMVTGILLGLAAEKDVFFVMLRTLPITETLSKRSSRRPLVFLLLQNATGQLKQEGDARPKSMKKTEAWVKVHLKSGKVYEGWPEFFGIGYDPSELYLSPACEWKLQQNKASFKLTEQSFKMLRSENIPENILERLKPLENKEIIGEEEFLDTIKKQIEEVQTVRYKTLILKHAQQPSPVPGAGIIIFEREIETLTFIDREKSKCLKYYWPP